MNATTAASRLRTYLNTDNNQVALVRPVNTRWIYVDDGACSYYLNAASVTPAKLKKLTDGGCDAYSIFCQQTDAAKFKDLPAHTKRAALEELGDTARNTGGW